jgi:hypothetical protein
MRLPPAVLAMKKPTAAPAARAMAIYSKTTGCMKTSIMIRFLRKMRSQSSDMGLPFKGAAPAGQGSQSLRPSCEKAESMYDETKPMVPAVETYPSVHRYSLKRLSK